MSSGWWLQRGLGLIFLGIFVASVAAGVAHAQGPIEQLENLNSQVLKLLQSRKYAEATEIGKRSLVLTEELYGRDHPKVATALINLGLLLQNTDRLAEAEPHYRRALAIDEKSFGREHFNVARDLDTLAGLLEAANRLTEAEPLYRRALAIDEKTLGPEHSDVTRDLRNLAGLLQATNRLVEAESLYHRALALDEKSFGLEHPYVARDLKNLAGLLQATDRLAEAESLYRRALAIDEKSFSAEDLAVLADLKNLAGVLQATNRLAEAEPLYRRVLAISEKILGPEHSALAPALNNVAGLLQATNRLAEAEPLMRRALAIHEKILGPEHSAVATDLINLGLLLQATNRMAEAEPIYRRALAIDEKSFGREHFNVARDLNHLGLLLQATNRLTEAEPLIRRALAISENSFGSEHSAVAICLVNLSQLLRATNRLAEAELLMRRALAIDEKNFGPEHPRVAVELAGLAVLRAEIGDWTEAAQLHRRAVPIMTARAPGGDADRSGFGKAALTAYTWGLRAAAQAVYRADAGGAKAREEGFQLAQWALQSGAADALAQMSTRMAKGAGPLPELVRQHQDLLTRRQAVDRRLLSAVGASDAEATEAIRKSLTALDAELDTTDQRLAREFEDYAILSNPKPLGVTAVQALLESNEALVLLLDVPMLGRLPAESLVWAVTKTDVSWGRIELETQALTDKVRALRCGLDDAEWEGIGREAQCAKLLGVGLPEEEDPLPFSFAIAHELYVALLGPVKDLIKDKHLLIVPSGPLTSLPFQVLVTEPPQVPIGLKYGHYRQVAWLARRQAITVLPSVASLQALREFAKGSPGPGVYIGYGDPVLVGNRECRGRADAAETCPGSAQAVKVTSASLRREHRGRRSTGLDRVFRKGSNQEAVLAEVRSLCPLPDTAQEIRCVAQSRGVPESEIHLKERATEAAIKGLSERGKLMTYKVIHFATHGLVAGDVEMMAKRQGEPALVLTPPQRPKDTDDDGLLTASEVTQLKLNADWVILSACNTAAGEKLGAEALSGLARAFFYAGDRALLVSHWPVYSDAAVRLITGTFDELKAHPEIGRAEAQRRAMVALMSDPSEEDNSHPSVWAPFVVVGEGGRATR